MACGLRINAHLASDLAAGHCHRRHGDVDGVLVTGGDEVGGGTARDGGGGQSGACEVGAGHLGQEKVQVVRSVGRTVLEDGKVKVDLADVSHHLGREGCV